MVSVIIVYCMWPQNSKILSLSLFIENKKQIKFAQCVKHNKSEINRRCTDVTRFHDATTTFERSMYRQLVLARVLICTICQNEMLVYIQTSKQTFKSFHIAYKVSCSAVAITSCRFWANIICFYMGTVKSCHSVEIPLYQ